MVPLGNQIGQLDGVHQITRNEFVKVIVSRQVERLIDIPKQPAVTVQCRNTSLWDFDLITLQRGFQLTQRADFPNRLNSVFQKEPGDVKEDRGRKTDRVDPVENARMALDECPIIIDASIAFNG